MSKKQKQTIGGAWYNSNQDENNEDGDILGDFAAAFKQDEFRTEPKTEKQKEVPAASEETKRIEALYPDKTQQNISLDQLIPAPAEWNFFPDVDRQTMKDLMQSIIDYGVLHPIIVWEQPDHTYMILGGHNRTQACRNLVELFPEQKDRFNSIPCSVYSHDTLDEIEARKIIIMDNTTQRQKESTAIMARSVINMNRLILKERNGKRKTTGQREKASEIIAKSLGVGSTTVKGYRRLENLIPELWDFLDRTDELKLTQGNAQLIAGLSHDLQKYILENKLFSGTFAPNVRKALRNATTTEDIDHAFEQVKDCTVSAKSVVSSPLPDGYVGFPIFGTSTELAEIKKLLREEFATSDKYSEDTKNLMSQILK